MVAISASVHPATTPRLTVAPEVMKRVIDDPVPPADPGRRTARMLLAQHTCDLRLGEVAFARVRLLEADGLSLRAWDQEGGRSGEASTAMRPSSRLIPCSHADVEGVLAGSSCRSVIGHCADRFDRLRGWRALMTGDPAGSLRRLSGAGAPG